MSLKNTLRNIFIADGHDEPLGQLDQRDRANDPVFTDDGTEAEAIAQVEVPRSSSQAGLAALRYRVVA